LIGSSPLIGREIIDVLPGTEAARQFTVIQPQRNYKDSPFRLFERNIKNEPKFTLDISFF
jgi:hypothetical protein